MKTKCLFGFSLFLFLVTPILFAVDLSAPLPMDPGLRYGKLENGFTYYIKANHMPDNRAELRLFVNSGSVQEDDDQKGLAHFGEHMAFNGTKNFPKQQLLDYLNSIGFGFQGGLNGGTSYDYISYQLQVPTDDPESMDKGFLILSDWAHAISFEPEEIDKERGVIMEEYRGGLSAWERCYRKITPTIYHGSRYADRMPIGDPEIIQHAPYEAFTRFYHDWYHPGNLAIAAVGDFDPAVIEAIIRKYFGPIPARENPRPLGVFPVPDNIEPLAVVASDPEMNMTRLSISWKHPVVKNQNLGDYLENFKISLFGNMLSNRFQERSNGEFSPISYGWAYQDNMGKSFSEFEMSFMIPPDSVLAALNYGLDELKRIKADGFRESELDRAFRAINRELENQIAEADKQESAWKVWDYLNHFSNGMPVMSPAQNLELINLLKPMVSLEEMNGIHDLLITDKNLIVSLMTSERKDTPTITEAQILQTIRENRSTQLAEYEDVYRDEPLIRNLPKGGKVVSEKYFPGTKVKMWKLSNGAKVYIKPTDFKNDELQLRSFSMGGRAMSTDEEYIHATQAVRLAQESGLGTFNKTELNKKLADKIVWLNPWIGRSDEGFSGSCSPQDMETMFQMIYLYSTAPNFNEQSYRSWYNKRAATLRDKALDPEDCFQDSINYMVQNRHLRAKAQDMAMLEAFDRETGERFFRQRFANLGDFQWVFVGNYDEAVLKRLCETYLGNSIPKAKPEKARDDGMRLRRGVYDFEMHKGIADKAVVRLVSTGNQAYDPEVGLRMTLAGTLASEKLRENIREARSGVYYIYCYGYGSAYPRPEQYAYLGLGCSTDRVEELITASLATLDSLKAGNFDEKYVNTVRQSQLKERESNLQRNDWWADRIHDQIYYHEPMDEILKEDELIRNISKESLAADLRSYFDFKTNFQRFVLYPEAKAEP